MKKELDCKGLQCPEPVARCRDLLRSDNPENLVVLVDNMAALENVRRFLGSRGYETTDTRVSNSEWRIEGTRHGEAKQEPARESAKGEDDCKTLVLLTSETLGRGDDTLGAKLMETFLGNLHELGPALWRLVLLNGGVKLAAREGAALDHLKKLEAGGTGVFVCGTCLMHYGLLEQKQVGETTNMMDIISALALAQKIIRP